MGGRERRERGLKEIVKGKNKEKEEWEGKEGRVCTEKERQV